MHRMFVHEINELKYSNPISYGRQKYRKVIFQKPSIILIRFPRNQASPHTSNEIFHYDEIEFICFTNSIYSVRFIFIRIVQVSVQRMEQNEPQHFWIDTETEHEHRKWYGHQFENVKESRRLLCTGSPWNIQWNENHPMKWNEYEMSMEWGSKHGNYKERFDCVLGWFSMTNCYRCLFHLPKIVAVS